jgi:hypothetical protein
MWPAKLFSSGGLIIFVKGTPSNAILDENFDFLGQKMTFVKNIFGASCDFHKSAEKFSKILEPLYPVE